MKKLTMVTIMNKPYPLFCKDCAWSAPEERSEWNLRCHHPEVNARDPWALAAAANIKGSDCRGVREKNSVWAVCGMKGKLWEPKKL